MTTPDRAQNYVAKCPPASEGGRNDALNKLAFAVLERFDLAENEYEHILLGWAGQCVPPISDKEALDTIRSAWKGAHGKGVIGSKARQGSSRHHSPSPARKSPAQPKPKAPAYALNDAADLPEPVEDGARLLIRTLFQPGEGIRIAPARWSDEAQKEMPDGGGICLTREEWLRKLDAVEGNPNGIFSSSKKTGIYIAVNPYRVGCTKDADVSAYRHALVEFDKESGLSLAAQWDLYQKSRIPCAAITYSGGESVHAWVKIDAADRKEFDERVRLLYAHFEAFHIDPANKNPGRLSRLPNCVRFDKRQELLALNTGCESFTEWQSEIQISSLGTVIRTDSLEDFDPDLDQNCLIGKRWLCRGGKAVFVGPSGIGKSSLEVQMAACWALGRDVFHISPVRPLRSVIIGDENDKGDIAEMYQGVCQGLGINFFNCEAERRQLYENLIFVDLQTQTGEAFVEIAHRIVDKFRPDLVWLDPLVSFAGCDITTQKGAAEFLRAGLNRVSQATGICWMIMHHTPKTSKDPKSKSSWKSSDYQYAGAGSYDISGWARAVAVLEEAGDGAFRMRLPKRGNRAGAAHPDGTPTLTLWLRHAEKGIFWRQVEPPTSTESETPKKAGRPASDWSMKEFTETLKGETLTRGEIKQRACSYGGFSASHFEHTIWKPLREQFLTPDGKKWGVK